MKKKKQKKKKKNQDKVQNSHDDCTSSPNRYTPDQIGMSHNLIIELEKLKTI